MFQTGKKTEAKWMPIRGEEFTYAVGHYVPFKEKEL